FSLFLIFATTRLYSLMQRTKEQPYFISTGMSELQDSHKDHATFSFPSMDTHQQVNRVNTTKASADTGSHFFAPLNTQILRDKENLPQQQHHQVRQQQKQQQQQQQQKVGTGQISSLHSKLTHEAEKIRKWKVQTEIELKEKDAKVLEMNHTVDALRKSILEMQLENENLSLKLQDEMDNREVINNKIESTRIICTALKDNTAQIDVKFKKCEEERLNLLQCQQQHQQQFEMLSESFQQLTITATQGHMELKSRMEQSEKEYKLTVDNLTSRLADADTKIVQKQLEIEENSEKLNQTNQKYMELQKHMSDLQQDKALLSRRLKETETAGAQLTTQLESMTTTLEKEKTLGKNLGEKILGLQSELDETISSRDTFIATANNTEKLYIERVNELKAELNTSQQQIEDEQKRCSDLKTSLSKSNSSIEELKSAKDMLILEKTEISDKMVELQKAKAILEESYTKSEDRVSQVTHEKVDCEKELQKLQTHSKDLENKLVSLEKHIETLSNEKRDLTTTLEQANTEINKLKDVKQDLAKISSEKKSTSGELKQAQSKIKKANAEILEVKSELKEALVREHSSLDKVDKLEAELESVRSELSTSVKSKDDIQCQLDDLKKNLKTVKGRLTSQTRQSSTFEDRSKSLNQMLEEAKNESTVLKEDKEKLQQQLKETTELMKDEVKKSKKILEESKAEKTKNKAALESQTKEITTVLQKYKMENEKIVLQKEKEIAGLMKELENKDDTSKQNNEKISNLSDEIKSFEEKLEGVEKENNTLKADIESKVKAVETFKEDIKSKDKDIKQLLESISCLKEKDSVRAEQVKEVERLKEIEWQEKLKELERLKEREAEQKEIERKQRLQPPSTPRTPIRPIKKISPPKVIKNTTTPRIDIEPATPQRSILRQGNSVSKKRRVMFAQDDDINTISDAESSSSELVEIELDEMENRLKNKKPGNHTPLMVRPSPKFRQSPSAVVTPLPRDPQPARTPTRTPLRPVPRGPSIHTQKDETPLDEKANFKSLFPDATEDLCDDAPKKPLLSRSKPKCNIKKTPNRSQGKFFKSSPIEKKKVTKTKDKDAQWFDMDAVFGFGTED
ncbi:unnamed protein product, partial [Owenia fusiformis]